MLQNLLMRTYCRSFARLEGHFQRDQNVRILVFSSADGRKILLPLPSDAYEQLLTQSNAALTSHQEETWLKEIIPRHRRTPVFSRE
jgi:hypothetical protein